MTEAEHAKHTEQLWRYSIPKIHSRVCIKPPLSSGAHDNDARQFVKDLGQAQVRRLLQHIHYMTEAEHAKHTEQLWRYSIPKIHSRVCIKPPLSSGVHGKDARRSPWYAITRSSS